MKQYGAFFASEITKKQVNVIFAKAKRGELKVEKWFLQDLYNLADYYGYDSNRSAAEQESEVKKILDAVFANDLVTAQTIIDETESKWYSLYSKKNQAKCDRTAFVA